MADTSISVNIGSGAAVDTRTESTNGNHRQVMVIGDPATNDGVAPVDSVNGLAVDVKQSALPTGASTEAKQDVIIGNYALRLDDTTTTSVTYVGKAAIGSATSAASWQIKKIDETSGMIVTWADGDASFNNVWDNRATTVTYS